MRFRQMSLIVLDSVGIGESPDAAAFGDSGANTLGHIAETVGPSFALPNLASLGLGNIAAIRHVPPSPSPRAHYGKMAEVSAGKDTMTGHWEIAGLRIDTPFETYPDGFPAPLVESFEKATGRPVIGNKPASGTEIITELGEEQLRTGAWIVYTSADSVFQLAAHEGVIPLEELYRACKIAREMTLEPPYKVGRVIARPFAGEPGAFERTENRRDYALKPPAPTVLNRLQEAGFDSIGIGKIGDIFDMEGITASFPTKSNDTGVDETLRVMKTSFRGLAFTNLVDFDSIYGHRRDPQGYADALMAFDARLPELLDACPDDGLLILTADHGNDPTFRGTDHTREYVPLLVYSPGLKTGGSLGVRGTFADVAATIADNFGVKLPDFGTSFLAQIQ